MNDSLLSKRDLETLERLIDAYTLPRVLEALAAICGDKAEHAQTNWQDRVLARAWRLAGEKLDSLVLHRAFAL